MYDVKFGVVHGIHKDRYAYRDNMTDVIVHHLTTDQKGELSSGCSDGTHPSRCLVKVKCRELVRKIATYKTILAVSADRRQVPLPPVSRQIQTLGKILLYEAPGDVPHDMKYRSTSKINKNIECSSMVVTSACIITCQDKRLHCYNFSGDELRVWSVLAYSHLSIRRSTF
jgi:intraflagellar transport protein 122